jgi:hypothetical protein
MSNQLTHEQTEFILQLAKARLTGFIPLLLDLIDMKNIAQASEQDLAVQLPIRQDEIDWRRRRMELAVAVLDESNIFDLETVARIVLHHERAQLFFEAGQQAPPMPCGHTNPDQCDIRCAGTHQPGMAAANDAAYFGSVDNAPEA